MLTQSRIPRAVYYEEAVYQIIKQNVRYESKYELPGIITPKALLRESKKYLEKRNISNNLNQGSLYKLLREMSRFDLMKKYVLNKVRERYCIECKRKIQIRCVKRGKCDSEVFPPRFMRDLRDVPNGLRNKKVYAYAPTSTFLDLLSKEDGDIIRRVLSFPDRAETVSSMKEISEHPFLHVTSG